MYRMKKEYEVPLSRIVEMETMEMIADSNDDKKVQGSVSNDSGLEWGGTYDGNDGQPD